MISVLMSVHNSLPYIDEAIGSVLCQSCDDFEFIIVDDGSTDDTLAALNAYAEKDPRIKVVQKGHSGLTDSLNEGLALARGDFIARMDADDIAHRERLGLQLSYMKNHDEVVLLGGGCVEIDEEGNEVKRHLYANDHRDLVGRIESGRSESFFPHSTAFFRREHVLGLGGYNLRFVRSQDLDLWLRIAERSRVACLDRAVIKLRRHQGMISNPTRGTTQAVYGLCAIICHHLRVWGVKDPSGACEDEWRSFLEWVERKAQRSGYLNYAQKVWKLQSTLKAAVRSGSLQRYWALAAACIRDRDVREIVWSRVRGSALALRCAHEWSEAGGHRACMHSSTHV